MDHQHENYHHERAEMKNDDDGSSEGWHGLWELIEEKHGLTIGDSYDSKCLGFFPDENDKEQWHRRDGRGR